MKWQQCREQACFSTKRDSAWIAAIFGVLVVLRLVLWFSDWSHPTRTASNTSPAAIESRRCTSGRYRAAPSFGSRSILLAMMKSFSCRPLIFFVWSETVA